MKVYVIQKGQYSDRHIVGVTTDKKTAKKICDAINPAFYEEFDTDQFDISDNKNGILLRYEVVSPGFLGWEEWIANFDDYGIYEQFTENTEYYPGCYIIYAESSSQAIKIAQDMAAESAAKKSGIS